MRGKSAELHIKKFNHFITLFYYYYFLLLIKFKLPSAVELNSICDLFNAFFKKDFDNIFERLIMRIYLFVHVNLN